MLQLLPKLPRLQLHLPNGNNGRCSRPSWWKPKPCGTTMPTTKVKVASHTNGAGTTRPWSSLWSSPSSQSHTGTSQDWCVTFLIFCNPTPFHMFAGYVFVALQDQWPLAVLQLVLVQKEEGGHHSIQTPLYRN